ncbi:MAG: TolC family protein [Pyramidobacter sp.]|jgi:outer membrane protein
MNKRTTSAFALLLWLAAMPAAAGEAVILTMGGALNRALESNLTVLKAQQALEGAKGAGKAAGAALNPRLNLAGEASAYDGIPGRPDREISSRVELSQSLYSGGKNRAAAQQGKLNVQGARQTLKDTRERVALTVWNTYCEVLYRREVLRNAKNALEYYVNAEKELESRVRYGLSTNLDLTRVRQQKENARAAAILADNTLESSRIELCRLLRMPPDTQIALSGSLEDGLPPLDETRRVPDNAEENVVRILERRGDYQALRAAAGAREKQIVAAKSGMLPSLTFSTGYRFAYEQSGLASAADDNQWTAVLRLDVPVYDGGLTSGQVRSARAAFQSARQDVQEKEEQIRADLVDSRLKLQNALETVIAGRSNVKLARESLSYAETGYAEGVNTQIDVIQARSELTQALQLLAQYLRDSREAQANLWRVQGVLVDRALRQENLRDAASPAAKLPRAGKKQPPALAPAKKSK